MVDDVRLAEAEAEEEASPGGGEAGDDGDGSGPHAAGIGDVIDEPPPFEEDAEEVAGLLAAPPVPPAVVPPPPAPYVPRERAAPVFRGVRAGRQEWQKVYHEATSGYMRVSQTTGSELILGHPSMLRGPPGMHFDQDMQGTATKS